MFERQKEQLKRAFIVRRRKEQLRKTGGDSDPSRPIVTEDGIKVWNLGNGIFGTTTHLSPQDSREPIVYVNGSDGIPLRHVDGSYIIQCEPDGRLRSSLDTRNFRHLKG
jgi:hypothetical protein